MNRFRTKKRAKDTSDITGISANPSDPPSVPTLKSSKTFRLGRKNAQEPERKVELDLANALPSSDDFRTSLLMSGLSARFSMLREQDDPGTKIGKASDDSVLFPKRQSRLNDFGFHSTGLYDIAESSSIKASIRPPFASNRIDSYHSVESSGDDGGSIMSRAKPGEGNNLFGGRQKIYKIPVGGSNGDKKLGGRALYEDDVSQSAFQKLREREREERDREQEGRDNEADSSFPLRSNSPPLLGYNRNRETSSTTSSGPSLTRSSTAATSVYSQRTPSVNGHSSPSARAVPNQSNGIDRSMTKGKRLYETGLDQHLHSQQHLAMNRLENLSKQQTFGARTPSPSPFPNGNTYEHTNVPGSITNHVTIRSASPPPAETTLGAFDFRVKTSSPFETTKSLFTAPPLSPPMSDGDDQASLPIQPKDRGKATALGTFSKPAQPYDEKKYSQRQLQMQQGRETPPLRKTSPPRTFNSRQPISGRTRTESNSTYSSNRSRSSSSAQREHLPQNRNMPPQVARMEAPATFQGVFFDSPNEDSRSLPNDVLENETSWTNPTSQKVGGGKLSSSNLPIQRPPESQHPANRPSNQRNWDEPSADTKFNDPPTISVLNGQANIEKPEPVTKDSSADSPTLGPVEGLSGLVRQHLRNDSGASSIYGAPSPGLGSTSTANPPPSSNPYGTKSNPWEINDWDEDTHGQSNGIKHAPSDPAMNSSSHDVPKHSTPTQSNGNLERSNQENHNPSWEDELAVRHTRNGSSETQKEQVDFTNKLASARKRVQDNLKSFAESDSRSVSPGPGMDWEKDSASSKGNPIGMPRAKSSRESILAKSKNGQSKAMKMLGIGNSTMSNSASPGKQKYNNSLWKQEEEEMLRGVKSLKNPPPTKAYRQARRDAQRDRERQVLLRHRNGGGRSSGDSDEGASEALPAPASGAASVLANAQARLRQHAREAEVEESRGPRAPSQESKGSVPSTNVSGSRPPSRNGRDRSSSDASGGSKGRNGRHRDDLARAMAEGRSSSAQGLFEDAASSYGPTKSPAFTYSPANASPGQQFSGSARSDSKSRAMGYFDNQIHPIQTNLQLNMGTSPRPSPVQPYAVNPTPALSYPSPLPSGNNTPTSQGFQSQGRIPANLKRVVNKSDISEPTLVSKTSNIITIDLPVGASLQSGMYSAPPLPSMDPRRRQTRTPMMFNNLMGRGSEASSTTSLPVQGYYEETSTFSADEADTKPKGRQKLRKISSEGGNLNARTRQAFTATTSPAVPTFSPSNTTSEINMF